MGDVNSRGGERTGRPDEDSLSESRSTLTSPTDYGKILERPSVPGTSFPSMSNLSDYRKERLSRPWIWVRRSEDSVRKGSTSNSKRRNRCRCKDFCSGTENSWFVFSVGLILEPFINCLPTQYTRYRIPMEVSGWGVMVKVGERVV